MATWMAHLRVAEKLLEKLQVHESSFAFGSLAPDSGMPNADWTEFNPPKTVTHFQGKGEKELRDLEFYRNYLRTSGSLSLEQFSFRLGYFFHLICDNLWLRWIWATTLTDHAALIEEKGLEAVELIKADWYGLDHLYLQDHSEGLFAQVVLQSDIPPMHLPFLYEDGFRFEIGYIREYYTRSDPDRMLNRPFPYLNETCMQQFVARASWAALSIYERMDETEALGDAPSALLLLSEQELQPFPPPLGDAMETEIHTAGASSQ